LKKLYVGNLPFSATDSEVEALFAEHGTVASVALVSDRDTGRPRGFGFVEMSDDAAAEKAMTALDGREMNGRTLRVNPAENKPAGGNRGPHRERW
jgi:RNA recognition motif-containing protein